MVCLLGCKKVGFHCPVFAAGLKLTMANLKVIFVNAKLFGMFKNLSGSVSVDNDRIRIGVSVSVVSTILVCLVLTVYNQVSYEHV